MDAKLNEVYKQRALCSVALANLAIKLGYSVYVQERTVKEWAVLYIEFPTGQVSYHFSDNDNDLLSNFKIQDKEDCIWDKNFNGRSATFMKERT